jgi:S-adenosylmethionine synthetase
MGRSLHVEQLQGHGVEGLEVEIVERKGKGHPDSLIDGASEAVSLGLCEYYLDNFGAILHHNVDKGILVGGKAHAEFGGGKVLRPIYILVAGRATDSVPLSGKDVRVPVEKIAKDSIKMFLRETLRFLDPIKHVRIETMIRQGSPDLISLFLRKQSMPLSNDTSIGVGYAPLSRTERLVLQIEQLLNSPAFKRRYPEVGEDVKVMVLRRKKKLDITLAAAMVAGKIPDASHYESVLADVREEVDRLSSKSELDVETRLNAGDDPRKGSYYLTVTGTSAEQGDDGNTGRGNRINGLISPMRQYSMEATAGKNPISHTGKLFNALALVAAQRISKEVPEVKECYVRLLSRIGSPIDQPLIASTALVLDAGVRLSAVQGEVQSILDESLREIRGLTRLILKQKIPLF